MLCSIVCCVLNKMIIETDKNRKSVYTVYNVRQNNLLLFCIIFFCVPKIGRFSIFLFMYVYRFISIMIFVRGFIM